MNLNYRGSPTTFLELTSITHSSHRICWTRRQRGTSNYGPQLRRKKSLLLWATGFLVQTFRKAEKPVQLRGTFHVSSVPLYEISTDFWCLSSNCWLWSWMDALDRGSPRSFSLTKDREEVWRKGLWLGSTLEAVLSCPFAKMETQNPSVGPGKKQTEPLWTKPIPSFHSLLRGNSYSNNFIGRARGCTRKSFLMLRRCSSHIPPCLQHGSAYQTGDGLPKGISSFSSQAAPRARRVRDSANQHMSKSLQPDTPASPCVFFPRLTHETCQLRSPDNCCLCCLCAHPSLEF